MSTKQCCVALSPKYKGALILVRQSSIELLGPGSAVLWMNQDPSDRDQTHSKINGNAGWTCEECGKLDLSLQNVLVLGEVKLEILDTLPQQKQALWRRVTWLNWLNRLQEISCSVDRIESLIQHLNIFFGREVCQSLPSDLLSELLGCEEIELLWVRDRYFQDWSWDMNSQVVKSSWLQLTPQTWQGMLLQALEYKHQSGSLPSHCPRMSLPASEPALKPVQWGEAFAKMNPFTVSGESLPFFWGLST